MKTNDVYYHPDDKFIWIKPNDKSWQYGYTRLSDGSKSGFDKGSIYEGRLIFISNTRAPNFAELQKLHPELFI